MPATKRFAGMARSYKCQPRIPGLFNGVPAWPQARNFFSRRRLHRPRVANHKPVLGIAPVAGYH